MEDMEIIYLTPEELENLAEYISEPRCRHALNNAAMYIRDLEEQSRLPLTKHQQDFYNALIYVMESGENPTHRYMAKVMGFNNHNSAFQCIVALEKKGWIKREDGEIVIL